MLAAAMAAAVLIMGPVTATAGIQKCEGYSVGDPWYKTIKVCYRGASGNKVACSEPGNHVQVTKTYKFTKKEYYGSYCISKELKKCETSRTKYRGNSNPSGAYC
jgi:hypothetical protein